jgi:hypothetical protein
MIKTLHFFKHSLTKKTYIMKKTIATICLSGLVILGLSSMREIAASGISGKVTPPEAVETVWAIKEADSVKTTVSAEGAFNLEVAPGTWKLVVAAKAPYRNAEIKELVVTADNTTDVGEIKLDK